MLALTGCVTKRSSRKRKGAHIEVTAPKSPLLELVVLLHARPKSIQRQQQGLPCSREKASGATAAARWGWELPLLAVANRGEESLRQGAMQSAARAGLLLAAEQLRH